MRTRRPLFQLRTLFYEVDSRLSRIFACTRQRSVAWIARWPVAASDSGDRCLHDDRTPSTAGLCPTWPWVRLIWLTMEEGSVPITMMYLTVPKLPYRRTAKSCATLYNLVRYITVLAASLPRSLLPALSPSSSLSLLSLFQSFLCCLPPDYVCLSFAPQIMILQLSLFLYLSFYPGSPELRFFRHGRR